MSNVVWSLSPFNVLFLTDFVQLKLTLFLTHAIAYRNMTSPCGWWWSSCLSVACSFPYSGEIIWTVNVFESLDIVWEKPCVFKIYIIEMMQGDDPWLCFWLCCSKLFIFHPLYSNILMKKNKSVEFVTCNYSPDGMLVLSLSIFKQYNHDNNTTEFHWSMHSNSHCIRISASCCRNTQPANHRYTCQKTLRAWQRL